MIGVVKKDLIMLRVQMIIFALVSLFFLASYLFIKVVVFESKIEETEFSRVMISIIPIVFALEFSGKNFEIEHANTGCEKYFNSLPITRSQMVLGKFLGSSLFNILGYVISILCITLLFCADGKSVDLKEIKILTIAFVVSTIFLAIQLPILVYNGNTMLSTVIPLVIVMIPIIIVMIVKGMDVNEMITSLSNYINDHELVKKYALAIVTALCAVVCTLSYFVSSYIYKRREFR